MEAAAHLSLETAVSPREKRYYTILLIISLIFWAAIVISVFGIFYAACAALGIWFANGLLIAYLRSESVLISEQQLPALHTTFRTVCERLGLSKIPELHVLQAGGSLNAFATRHSGRDFVVLFSDVVEAYGENSPEVMFIMGHEIGHIRRKHILKHILLLPGAIIPLIGPAYHRACEATCDRFGILGAAKNFDASKRAMMILSGGKDSGKQMNPAAFAQQHKKSRGFFVSWHELASTYPTLSQRMYNIDELSKGHEPSRVGREPIAYLFAFFFSRSIFLWLIIAYFAIIAIAAVTALGAKAKAEAEKAAKAASAQSADTDYGSDDEPLDPDARPE